MTNVEVHTENGVESHDDPCPQAGCRHRATLIVLLVGMALIAVVVALLWLSGIADASAPGGCGGG